MTKKIDISEMTNAEKKKLLAQLQADLGEGTVSVKKPPKAANVTVNKGIGSTVSDSRSFKQNRF